MLKVIKENPSNALELSDEQLFEAIIQAKQQYYYPETYGEPILTDAEYDALEETLTVRGKSVPVGVLSPESELEDVDLPVNLPSLDKMKPRGRQSILPEWQRIANGTPSKLVCLSVKYDGKSGLLWNHGSGYGLYSRGEETTGKNLSHLIPFMVGTTFKGVGLLPNTGVRGELIVSRTDFERFKDIIGYSAMRNAVCGITGSKSDAIVGPRLEFLKCVRFLAYEYIDNPAMSMPIQNQCRELKSRGFEVAEHQFLQSHQITKSLLSENYKRYRSDCIYENDGIVITANGSFPRTLGLPDYSIAYKEDSIFHTVTVTHVHWNVGKTGRVNPKVEYDTVIINGADHTLATAHNAKYIRANSIGPGSVINIIKSGDVIPYILSVVSPSPTGPLFPTDIECTWDRNGTYLMATEITPQQQIAILDNYLKTLNVKSIGPKNLEKMYHQGITSIADLNHLTYESLRARQIPGLGETSIRNYVDRIDAGVKDSNMVTIAVASGMLGAGIGTRLFTPLFQAIPTIVADASKYTSSTDFKRDFIHRCLAVPGLAEHRCDVLMTGIFQFAHTYPTLFTPQQQHAINANTAKFLMPPEQKASSLSPQDQQLIKTVVLTGTRDAWVNRFVVEHGGKVTGSVTGNTTLLVKAGTRVTTKEQSAAKKGIPVWDLEQFKSHFAAAAVAHVPAAAAAAAAAVAVPRTVAVPCTAAVPRIPAIPVPSQTTVSLIPLAPIEDEEEKAPPSAQIPLIPIIPQLSVPGIPLRPKTDGIVHNVSDILLALQLNVPSTEDETAIINLLKTPMPRIAIKIKLGPQFLPILDNMLKANKIVKDGVMYKLPAAAAAAAPVEKLALSETAPFKQWPLIDIRSIKVPKPEMSNVKIVEVLLDLVKHIKKQIIEAKRAGTGSGNHSRRLTAINKAAEAIRQFPTPITSGKQAMKIPGVGKGTATRIDEILATGTLTEMGTAEFSPETRAINELTKVHGIGPGRARTLVNLGVTGIDDLIHKYQTNKIGIRANQLTKTIVMGLEYYNDLQERIPYAECQQIEQRFNALLARFDPSIIATVCGSYRRKCATSGDIDILITHPRATTKQTLDSNLPMMLPNLVKFLELQRFIVGSLTTKGHNKYMGICKVLEKGRRIDIMFVATESYGPAVTYFTGSANYNVAMRHIANERGMTLNEYFLKEFMAGIEGSIIPTTDERDVFTKVGIVYVEPERREM